MISSTTEADPAIVTAYREQAAAYHEAMVALLESGRYQAAALIAVQAVRSAAMSLLATRMGAEDMAEDPIALLWRLLPPAREVPALQHGANVFALHEDLTLYAYDVDAAETREMVDEALAFRAWVLAPETQALIRSGR